MEIKSRKSPDSPMKYFRMLFFPKNERHPANMLPITAHPVKNIEIMKFPGDF